MSDLITPLRGEVAALRADLAQLRAQLTAGLAVPDPVGSDGKALVVVAGKAQWGSAGGGSSGAGIVWADFDATPAELQTAYSRPITLPYDWTITAWRIVAGNGEAGSAEFDILKLAALGGAPASIVGTTAPKLTATASASGTDLTGWTVSGTAGELLMFRLLTVAALKSLRIELEVTKS